MRVCYCSEPHNDDSATVREGLGSPRNEDSRKELGIEILGSTPNCMFHGLWQDQNIASL